MGYSVKIETEGEEMKELFIGPHAQQRMKDRNVTNEQIVQVYQHATVIWPNKDYENVHNYKLCIDGRDLVIGVKDDEPPYFVLTILHRN